VGVEGYCHGSQIKFLAEGSSNVTVDGNRNRNLAIVKPMPCRLGHKPSTCCREDKNTGEVYSSWAEQQVLRNLKIRIFEERSVFYALHK